jgi:hypothetical protein
VTNILNNSKVTQVIETKSQNVREQMLHEGYRNRHDKLTQDGSSFEEMCERECAGRLEKKTDGTVEKSTEYMHAPDNAKNESEKINATVRDRAENGVAKTSPEELRWKQLTECYRIRQAKELLNGNERGVTSTNPDHSLFRTSFFLMV